MKLHPPIQLDIYPWQGNANLINGLKQEYWRG